MSAAKQTDAPTQSDLAGSVRTMTEESIKSAQGLFEAAFGQARQFADTVTDAALATVKRNQDVAQQAIGSLAGVVSDGFDGSLSNLPEFNVRETVTAGFELVKNVIDAQRELAERIIGAATSAAGPAA